jgi:hypothetical protein
MSSSAQMQRRRSQRKGTSEGNHLEDARLGRRRSTRLSRTNSGLDKSITQPKQTMNDPGRSQNVASDLGSSDAHALKSTTQQLVPANDPATATISDHHTPDPKNTRSHRISRWRTQRC